MVIEVARDSFDEGEGSSDRVGGESEFAVDVPKNEDKGFLHFVKVSGGEEFVEGEIFH